jgi:para-nitrobenzyl esterase
VTEPEARTTAGRVRGRREGGLAVFRGIPYAEPPIGAARLQAPRPVRGWDGVREADAFGPPSPQDAIMAGRSGGDLLEATGDDWLTVNVWTPDPDPAARRPVMVWIHGGAYKLGFSGSPGYDAQHIVRDGGVVFVSLNYRLGVEGFAHLDGAPANRGLLDQVAALEWVRENITAFGGDPGQVTVFAQSAGAHSLACLMAMPAARGLFRRAILQSAPLGLRPASPARAARISRHFTKALGGDPRSASVDEILSAQTAAITRVSGPGGLVSPPFCPTVDADPLTGADPWPSAATAADVDVLIGFTRTELNSFLNGKPVVERLARLPLVGRRAVSAVKTWGSRRVFGAPSMKLADAVAGTGRQAFTYRFDWAPRGSIFGAGHCIELPFLLGDRKAWAAAPMLGDADWDNVDELGRTVRKAWITFACGGRPDDWPAHTPGADPGRYWFGPIAARGGSAEAV